MAGQTRVTKYSEGVSTTAPVQTFLEANAAATFASDNAFVTSKGSPASNGDFYYNTTDHVLRLFKNGAWTTEQNQAAIELLINQNANQAAASGNAGLVVEMSDATNVAIKYDSTLASKFKGGEVGSESELISASTVQTMSGAKTFSSAVNISDVTQSTGKDTGSIITEGGIGVEKNLHVGGDAVITGDLTVNGTTTTINTATLDVTDANITVNNGGNQISADDTAGLTVEMSDATNAKIIYDKDVSSRWRVGEVGSEVEVVTVSNSQVITNKDIDGGTASNTNRITIPKDTKANIDALTRLDGTFRWATDRGSLYSDDGSKLIQLNSETLVFRDKKATSTLSGTFNSGSWQTRTLNNVSGSYVWGSLTSNQVTLEPGTYTAFSSAPAGSVNDNQSRLQNITDASTEIEGTPEFADAATGIPTKSFAAGTFTITATKTFELQHQCQTSKANNGFGTLGNFGIDIVYAFLIITKIA